MFFITLNGDISLFYLECETLFSVISCSLCYLFKDYNYIEVTTLANKKIWAYAKENNDEYIAGEKHPLKIYYIWEALKLKDEDIHQFNKLTFMSTHKESEKRVELSAVKTGFYRYKKGNTTSEWLDGDSDSLSHSIAIQVLAEMDEINFSISQQPSFRLKVKSIRSDDLKIQLTNKDKYAYYYPDLICEFDEPSDLAAKWGNKLAIEVKHTHACEPEKISDFQNHCIPIIEVNIENISIEKKFNTKNPTPDDLEKYYNYLKKIFGKQVFGRVLSDPVSVIHFEHAINEKVYEINYLNNKLKEVNKNISNMHDKISLNSKEYNELKNNNLTLSNNCTQYRSTLKERDKKIAEMERRGLRYYMLNLLGLKS